MNRTNMQTELHIFQQWKKNICLNETLRHFGQQTETDTKTANLDYVILILLYLDQNDTTVCTHSLKNWDKTIKIDLMDSKKGI